VAIDREALFNSGFHVRQRVAGELFFGVEHASPDFGGSLNGGQGHSEGFADEPAVEVNLFEGGEHFGPIDMALAGSTAVVFGDVDQSQIRRGFTEGGGGIFFFDVRVERVVDQAAVGVIHCLDEAHEVGNLIEEVAFEAVEGFEAEDDVGPGGVFGDFAHRVDAPAPFVGGWWVAGELADGGVDGADENFGADGVATIECALAGIDGGGANFRIGADRIVGGGADGRSGAAKIEIVEVFGPGAVVGFDAEDKIEDRHFDAVIALPAEHFQDRELAIVEAIGPKHEVDGEGHSGQWAVGREGLVSSD
jgi:hypothetical protein